MLINKIIIKELKESDPIIQKIFELENKTLSLESEHKSLERENGERASFTFASYKKSNQQFQILFEKN